ncbi:hypothetical protein BDV95DRAFT_313427 [Massariosphaeria phaeospora]|uniref:Uncharacterized protein n=1 Tax=Massariosphaeria phaeospora TaxID=100035 RepID=A0A7C8IKU6_9PLEO|nr:hypothetical protein BDV95DRAFT_313427 [Massariosphaeria phaeospora]
MWWDGIIFPCSSRPGKANPREMSIRKVLEHIEKVKLEGPSSPGEWWIEELVKTAHNHPDSIYMKFDIAALWMGFTLVREIFPTYHTFMPDTYHLITLLPIQDGAQIERKVLIELLQRAAQELEIPWWNMVRERAAIVFVVMHACMLQKRFATSQTENELSELVGKMKLGRDDAAIMSRLADTFDGELSIKL